ncbi:MAG: TlyA family RNA methyltransferase [Anaerolineaceae bacterium]|nr:TlyA family RNA methyltransferase [Anaerolineaceae bacterium]
MKNKIRLDVAMVNHGLVESRNQAQRVIMAGQVQVNGVVIIKASEQVNEEDMITLDSGPQFVSRGGEKLQGALDAFQLHDFSGKICADVGASTGGFTDCLLQHGATKVYAIDVGYGILHWKMRQDERVVCLERTNARYVEKLADPVDFICIDVSFISLDVILPVIRNWYGKNGGEVIALIKPQFEAGKEISAKGRGVIRDPAVHKNVLTSTLQMAASTGFRIKGLAQSPIVGPKGNKEFLLYCSSISGEQPDSARLIRQALLNPSGKD